MQEIIELTKDLMCFQTVHGKRHEILHCANFIERYLNSLKIEYRRLDHANIPSLLVLPHKGYAPILLMTHIDVVDAPRELFEPFEKDQKLYGRGSLDDKYAVALSLVLLKNYLKRLRMCGREQQDLPFGLLITGDEELGGFNGAKQALKQVQSDFCIVLDGGCLEKIVVKENGVTKIKLVSKGPAFVDEKACAKPNAIENLIEDFMKLKTWFVKSVPKHPHRAVIIKNIRTQSATIPIVDQNDLALGSDVKNPGKNPGFNLCIDNDDALKTIQNENKPPNHHMAQSAEAFLEIRYTATDDMEQLLAKLRSELASEMIVESITPVFPDGESTHLNLLLDIAPNTRIGFEDGANDARFLARYGIKGIIWGADGHGSRHTKNEHVHIKSIYTLYNFLDEFMKQSENLTKSKR